MLALTLQVSPHEVAEAEELVNLLTDLEPAARKDCEFILFVRRDVEQSDRRRLGERLLTKFPKSRVVEAWDFAVGWPHGPNTMWCSLIRQLYHMQRMDELVSDGALTFEADCLPIKPNWISILTREWEQTLKDGKEVMGHLHGGPGAPTHINGNAVFRTDFWHRHEELTGCHGMEPWDVAFAPIIMKVGVDTPYINQWYRMNEFTLEHWNEIAKTPCAFFHGVKHPDGRKIARQQLLCPTQPPQATATPTSRSKSKVSRLKSARSRVSSARSSRRSQH
jgi:hypothetical protein